MKLFSFSYQNADPKMGRHYEVITEAQLIKKAWKAVGFYSFVEAQEIAITTGYLARNLTFYFSKELIHVFDTKARTEHWFHWHGVETKPSLDTIRRHLKG